METNILAYDLFVKHGGLIRYIVRKYVHLDPAIEESDLLQEAFIPLEAAVKKLRSEKDVASKAKETTILHFLITKHFNNIFKDKMVPIIELPNGDVFETTQSKYHKIKKSLPVGTRVAMINPFVQQLSDDW